MPSVQVARPYSRAGGAAGLLLFGMIWLGCAKDEPTVLGPSSSSAGHDPGTISGRLLGPDGRNVCRTVREGTILVRLLNPDFDGTNDAFLGAQDLTCPDNQYSLAFDDGTAHLRVELPINPHLGQLPWRNLDRVSVPPSGAHHTVHVTEGTALGGRATLDGNPFEGAPIGVVYGFNPNFGATSGSSGPNGRWVDFFGRSPMILEEGNRYFAFGCDGVLGARQVEGFPEGSFLFPGQRRALNCRLETAPATRFSHSFTRLVVTPMPGDIGGAFSAELAEQYGFGWGVQFPITPGSSPQHGGNFLSEIFNGGLIIGVPAQRGSPPRALTGVDPAGEIECGGTCRDLGLDGRVTFMPGGLGDRRHVTWRYTDAGSADRAGLEVIQHSMDGRRPHAYVLFQYRIRNIGPSSITLYAGFFGDWDVHFDPFDDRGRTALDGELMYQASVAETPTHVGTLLLGDAPVTGNYFFTPQDFPSVADQIRALRGNLVRRTARPDDLRYIHGAGPFTIPRRESKDLWIAVVAGENEAQLFANAAAARADVAERQRQPLTDAGETSSITTRPRSTNRGLSRPICKNCKPH